MSKKYRVIIGIFPEDDVFENAPLFRYQSPSSSLNQIEKLFELGLGMTREVVGEDNTIQKFRKEKAQKQPRNSKGYFIKVKP